MIELPKSIRLYDVEDLKITDEWDKRFVGSLDPKTLAQVLSAALYLKYYSLITLTKKAFAGLDSYARKEFLHTLMNN